MTLTTWFPIRRLKSCRSWISVRPSAWESGRSRGERKLQKLDEKVVATLPAAAILNANEKLMDLFARGKKRGKLDSSEMMEVLDDMDLDSDQMEQIYDSLDALS